MMARQILFLLCWLLGAVNAGYRICVTEGKRGLCEQNPHPTGEFDCVYARDRLDCVRKLANGEADLTSLPANEAYAVCAHYKLQTLLRELRDTKKVVIVRPDVRYDAAVLVRKTSNIRQLSDLRGKSACHTGYLRTTGWNIPMAILRSMDVLGAECDDLGAWAAFTGRTCLPGKWTVDRQLNERLKKRYRNLCELCGTNCQTDDYAYFGYEGAIKCLTETNAEVAFTKQSVVQQFFQKFPKDVDQYEILCANGTRVNALTPCPWGSRPADFVIGRAGDPETERLKWALVENVKPSHPARSFFQVLFSNDEVEGYVADTGRPPAKVVKEDYPEFLLTLKPILPPECQNQTVKMCVTSDVERQKCEAFKIAGVSQMLRPTPACYQTTTKQQCLSALQQKNADVLAADTGIVFAGAQEYDLKPILTEVHNNTGLEKGVNYYAVAVVKATSSINQISDLRGKKACSTGVGRTAGWNIPVGTLIKTGQISAQPCELEQAVGDYFSAGCAPGSKVPSLCQLCRGNEQGEQKCSASSNELYFGYEGAFRCLVEGGGDVAFVQHYTPLIAGQENKPEWLKSYSPNDFSLLCPNGGRSSVNDYLTCNWGSTKAHQMITGNTDPEQVFNIQLAFDRADEEFGLRRSNAFFRLFENFNNKSDLLFKNAAVGLSSFPDGTEARDSLGEELYNTLEKVYCRVKQ